MSTYCVQISSDRMHDVVVMINRAPVAMRKDTDVYVGEVTLSEQPDIFTVSVSGESFVQRLQYDEQAYHPGTNQKGVYCGFILQKPRTGESCHFSVNVYLKM